VSTTASSTGNITVTVDYDESSLVGSESGLALLHHDGADWVDVTSAIDDENDKVSGIVTGLSPFVLVEHLTCCEDRVGNANGAGTDEPTIGDVTVMIDALFVGNDWGVIPCIAEADINQSGGADPQGGPTGDITIGDVTYLIDYLFVTGPDSMTLPDCL
jgi:hypothetical protein